MCYGPFRAPASSQEFGFTPEQALLALASEKSELTLAQAASARRPDFAADAGLAAKGNAKILARIRQEKADEDLARRLHEDLNRS